MSEDTGQTLRILWGGIRSDYKGRYWLREENKEEKVKVTWTWFYEQLNYL